MIERIQLKCFMKHEDLDINFTQGLNVTRSPNESGKSSVLLGVAYALFGSSVLPDSLDEVVTWGRKPSELKVVLDFAGHTFTRSKSGAEVTRNGEVVCTGQTDVSEFASKLLGAEAKVAMALMFSNQGGLRGVLEDGPKATATMIESLSDMDIFDRIIESAQSRLAFGSTALFEERLKGLNAQLEMLPVVVEPDEPDLASTDARIVDLEEKLNKLNGEVRAVEEVLVDQNVKRQQRDSLVADIAKLENQITETGEKREALMAMTWVANLETRLGSLLKLQEEVKFHGKRKSAWGVFLTLPVQGGVTDQTPDMVEAWLQELREKLSTDSKTLSDTRYNIALLESKLVTSSTCGFCGQDVSQFPEVAKKNAAILDEIEVDKASCVRLKEAISILEGDIEATKDVLERHKARMKAVAPILDYVEVDERVTPSDIVWMGDPVMDDLPDYTDEIARIKAEIKERDENHVKIKTLSEVIDDLHGRIKNLYTKVPALMPEGEYNEMLAKFDELSVRQGTLFSDLERHRAERVSLIKQYEENLALYKVNAEKGSALRAEIEKVQADIASVGFNNALLKKIRAVRPVVGNKLWNLVLASVSTLFSQIRGTKSVVTRNGNGFRVNGQSVSTLSGSTKDALGAALRVALTKTFIPGCRLLILDEPMAAMDSERAQSLLAFVAGCGFDQVLLVTHDPVSELFADNLIQLGA